LSPLTPASGQWKNLIEHVFRFAPESGHGADLKCSESSWGAARPTKDGVDRKATGGDSVVAAQVEYGLVYDVVSPSSKNLLRVSQTRR